MFPSDTHSCSGMSDVGSTLGQEGCLGPNHELIVHSHSPHHQLSSLEMSLQAPFL